MQSNGIVFILSAPSGAGKTTICKLLKQKLPDLKFSISHTTREPRDGETEGTDYHFISQKEFENKIQRGDFIEWAKVFKNSYGTGSEFIDRHLNKGENVLVELDVQGAKSLRNINYKAVFIFIMPPSLQELKSRLNKRATESGDNIQKRLEESKKEIPQSKIYDYILTNIDAEATTNNLHSIITAEQFREKRYQPTSPDIRDLIDKKENN
jgi:guanylate kinase